MKMDFKSSVIGGFLRKIKFKNRNNNNLYLQQKKNIKLIIYI